MVESFTNPLLGKSNKIDIVSLNLESCIDKVINQDGWDIPKFSEKELKDTDLYSIKGIVTTRKLYVFKEYLSVEISLYSLDSDNNLQFWKADAVAKTIISYSYNGKVFMYSILYTYGNKKNENSMPIGAATTMFYIDRDGDGKFETRYEKIRPENIPDWVVTPLK